MHVTRKAFTLIELLVVIAIIAILAVVVVLTLNPAELLRQSRDSNRLSDLATLNSALNLYTTDQAGASSFSMGSSNVTYVSIPDPKATTTAGTDCSGIGFPSGGAFHCAASSTYRNVNGTGWIPVNLQNISSGPPISALPVDPVNSSSSNLYYTYQTNGTTFKLRAVPESQKYLAQAATNQSILNAGSNLNLGGGSGWVLIPGNSTFGTNNFWVMKYAAVCSDGNGNVINSPADGDGYNNGTTACVPANNEQIASLSGGYPIVDINHDTAVTYCQSIGAHLMTNDEYMTINTNAAGQGSNWTGGTVGSGGMYLGNANNASEYPADPNDANGYSGETTKTVTNTNDERRTYTLSNGSVVWDMSGNVWEIVARSVLNQGDNGGNTNVPAVTGGGASWNWVEFTNISAWTSDVAQVRTAPPNSTWNSAQGMGRIYTFGTGGIQGVNAFIRGSNYNGGTSTGPFSLNLNWVTWNGYIYVGFRCAR